MVKDQESNEEMHVLVCKRMMCQVARLYTNGILEGAFHRYMYKDNVFSLNYQMIQLSCLA